MHVLESPQAVVEWISSTGLRPFLDALEADADREAFVALLHARARVVSETGGRAGAVPVPEDIRHRIRVAP